MKDFLTAEELEADTVKLDGNAKNAIDVKDGSFSWERSAAPILNDINLSVKPGELVAVVGKFLSHNFLHTLWLNP